MDETFITCFPCAVECGASNVYLKQALVSDMFQMCFREKSIVCLALFTAVLGCKLNNGTGTWS